MPSSPITVSDIPTLGALYEDSTLGQPLTAAFYPPNPVLLSKVSLVKGDITQLAVDVTVNAANSLLLGGGGVDGAIHAAAGPDLLKECRTLGGCRTGDCKMTNAYNLPSKRVCHCVGPIYDPSERDACAQALSGCYRSALEATVKEGLKTIAFCSISTGVYGYPLSPATSIALSTVRDYLVSPSGESLDRVVFVVFSQRDFDLYSSLIPLYFPLHEALEERASEEIRWA